jgi:hypothetical protein
MSRPDDPLAALLRRLAKSPDGRVRGWARGLLRGEFAESGGSAAGKKAGRGVIPARPRPECAS